MSSVKKRGGGVNGIPEIIYYLRLLICMYMYEVILISATTQDTEVK